MGCGWVAFELCLFTILTPNSRSVFRAGVSLNINFFIRVCI